MVQLREKGSPHVFEDFGLMPVPQTSPTGGRIRILVWEISPPRPCLEDPEDSFKTGSIICRGTPSFWPRRPRGNQRFDLFPLRIAQHRFSCPHRITSDKGYYAKSIERTRAYFLRDDRQLRKAPGFATACSTYVYGVRDGRLLP
jgi:hypothetical protein